MGIFVEKGSEIQYVGRDYLFRNDIQGNESVLYFLKCVKKEFSSDLTQFNHIFLNPTTWRYFMIIYFLLRLIDLTICRVRSGFRLLVRYVQGRDLKTYRRDQ